MRKTLFLLLILHQFIAFSQSWKPINGSKNKLTHYTAFTNATIYVKHGEVLENATLLIKGDEIIQVGQEVQIPEEAIVIDSREKFIYPSFIDLLTQYGIEGSTGETRRSRSGAPQLETKKQNYFYWNESIQPENKTTDLLTHQKTKAEKFRKMGFGAVLTHRMDGLIRGTSALVSLGDKKHWSVLNAEAAMHYSFFKGASKQTYPSSLMGMIALIRQAHHDANYYNENQKTVAYNHSLHELNTKSHLPKIMEAGNTLSMLRAAKIANEFDFKFILKGDGTEYKRLSDIKATASAVIVPLTFPKAYAVQDPYEAMRLPLSKMKEWELADKNLKMLAEQEIAFAITTQGVKTEKEFFTNLKMAIDAGLDRSLAIQALTEVPAQLLGEEKIGTLETGKLANFIVTSKSIFSDDCRLYSNWVEGKQFIIEDEKTIDFEGEYSLNINKKDQYELKISEAAGKGWKASISEKNKDDFQSAKFSTNGNRITLNFTIDSILYRLGGSVNDNQSRIWTGKSILNGNWVDWAAIKKGEKKMTKEERKEDSLTAPSPENPKALFPNMAFGWDSLPTQQKSFILRNATVWTNEEEGILKSADVVVMEGKIQKVGYKLNLEVLFPKRFQEIEEIDVSGLHLTSGIIDEHSHIAIERGVNESGQAVTAEVSIGDVVNSDDINIYRQLSGGVTASQLLHGSANPIGGQSALIKLRWGHSPEKMKIQGADGFIKFALGENVKQSNWGDNRQVRFPQTRMGVEQVFYDAFIRAKEYKDGWRIYNSSSKKEKKKTAAPRMDLELEALAQILDTQRFISCHSYIQSEINMLMHVADSMGFTVNTFTHILEGYKVADKMREHGAAASTFSDWWAYKFEVNDAIPYNGAILHEQGVLTGFNSDDAEMGRRLNQEAAKAVKYGELSEEEAWKFVTLNPAKMLHLDDRMGSIKEGKDADLVLWTEHPMSIYTKAKRVYIDGIPYFDADRDLQMRKQLGIERERIIAKMLKAEKAGKPTQKVKAKKERLYECDTIEF